MFTLLCEGPLQEDAVKAEFVFENPNAKGSCGCGESFNV
jgi:Fe-S cluster assembly iron-binding protein IscA